MTPKEKAEELVKKFHPFTYTAVHAHKTSGEYADAKECALKAVDEIINLYDAEEKMGEAFIEYWQEVKQEIEKLGNSRLQMSLEDIETIKQIYKKY